MKKRKHYLDFPGSQAVMVGLGEYREAVDLTRTDNLVAIPMVETTMLAPAFTMLRVAKHVTPIGPVARALLKAGRR